MDLNGKVSLVTGGATGIGAAICRRLAEHGSDVVIADIDEGSARSLASEIGSPASALRLDVTDQKSWLRATEYVAERFGRLDIVDLNAGVMLRPRGANMFDDPLLSLSATSFKRVTDVNVDGVVLGILATLPLLAESHGTAVATSSSAGLDAFPGDPIYSMTKHALIGLVRSLAPRLNDRGIRLCAICPSGIDTEMCPPDLRAERLAAGRVFAAPDYVAEGFDVLLEHGRPGDVWMAREQDHGFWSFTPSGPSSPGQDFVSILD